MTWDDVEEVLYDGKPEDMLSIRCPECGGHLTYDYQEFDDKEANFDVSCEKCYTISRGYLGALREPPGCVKYFGQTARIDKDLKLEKTA